MNIIVLDGYTLNPGDLNWDDLNAMGACTIYDRTAPETVLQRAREADIILTNKCPLPGSILNKLPKLKFIGVLATGYNIVDVQVAHERGIRVSNVPTYGTDSVAQLVFAHLLHLMHHVGDHAHSVSEGEWSASVDWSYWNFPLHELKGKTMGIIGYGRIGQTVARLSDAFGMHLLVSDRISIPSLPDGCRQVDLDTLLAESDVISLHCPLTPETENMIGRKRIEKMKSSAILINTSRGPLIDEHALAEALNSGRIAGAGLDVLQREPPEKENPLFSARNCYITPHLAWATFEARQRLMGIVLENVRKFIEGNPQNLV